MKVGSSAFAELRYEHGLPAALGFAMTLVALFFLPGLAALLMGATCAALLFRHGVARPRAAWPLLFGSQAGWMAVLYVLYVAGVGWSANLDYALFDLQVKASMLLLPLVLVVLPPGGRRGGDALLRLFGIVSAVAVVVCVGMAFWRFGAHCIGYFQGQRTAPSTSYFVSSNFSLFLHPSYFAMYLSLGAFHTDPERGDGKRWRWTVHALQILGIVLCASKLGWMVLASWWIITLVVRWRDRQARQRALLGLLASAALLTLLVRVSPFFREKVDQFGNAARGAPVDVSDSGSTASRRMIWGAALPLIEEHMPWGTGTGDVKDILLARYAELGYTHAVEQRLNAHSQWIQTTLTLGVPGALMLLAMILVPVPIALRRRDGTSLVLSSLLASNWAVESMLETQAGVIFLAWAAFMVALRHKRN